MKRIRLIAILIITCTRASAQYVKTIRQYFDVYWNEITEKQKIKDREYAFYRVAKKTEDRVWHVKDYYAVTNSLQMEGMFSDDSLNVKNGLCYFYYYNGQLKSEARYYENKPVGLHKAYSINGKLLDSSRFKSTGFPYHKTFLWDEKGRLRHYGDFDTKGSGKGYAWGFYPNGDTCFLGKYAEGYKKDSTWVYYHLNGELSLKKYYDKGELLRYECFNEQGDFISDSCDITYSAPEPGYNVSEYVNEHIVVPKALSRTDKAGPFWVNIAFVVDVDGTIKNVYAECPSYQSLTVEALKVMSTLPKWEKPAMVDNIPIPLPYKKAFKFLID